jgi:hypothetical protein
MHLTYTDTGAQVTLGFPTRFARGLHAILLAAQPVAFWFEDK